MPRSRRPATGGLLPGLLAIWLAGCLPAASASPAASPPGSPTVSPTSSATPAPTATRQPTATAVASPTPEPSLSLSLPAERDARQVRVSVAPEVAADAGGRMVVTVTSLADAMIDELVLRWPTDLSETLWIAPFEPTFGRIADGGPPLVQPWTKWVVGPGERGEPAGTTSLGWGPLLAGATLEITLVVERRAAGDVSFDLQLLAGEAILQLEEGEPAELRVSVP